MLPEFIASGAGLVAVVLLIVQRREIARLRKDNQWRQARIRKLRKQLEQAVERPF